MGKITLRGPVPKDDPMFLTGLGSSGSSTNTASNTTGMTPGNSGSANEPETEADGQELGALRMARFKHQSKQFRKQSQKD